MILKLVSFDPLRSCNIPNVRSIKPANWLKEKFEILSADWVLYPGYWQINSLVYAWEKPISPNINSFHPGHGKIEMTRALQAAFPDNVLYSLILPNAFTSRTDSG